MNILVSFLMGFFISSGYNWVEKRLIKDYKEINKLRRWPFYICSLLVGILCAFAYKSYGNQPESLMYMILIIILIFLACFDLKYMLLPTKVIYLGVIAGALCRIWQTMVTREYYFIINGILAAIIGYGIFYVIFYGSQWILKKEGLGFGDVRLMALIGMFIGLEHLAIMLIISSLLAALVGSILFLLKGKSEVFPFGPFLCIGAIIMGLVGNQIVNFYLKCIGL